MIPDQEKFPSQPDTQLAPFLSLSREVAHNTFELSFDLKGKDFPFIAGQYVQLTLPYFLHNDPKGNSRFFSIASSPNEKTLIKIAVRVSKSPYKQILLRMSPGTEVQIAGPFGDFILPKDASRPIVFLAGGIGITPFLSMLGFAAESKLPHNITLIYANANQERAAYLSDLEALKKQNSHFSLKKIFGPLDAKSIKQAAQSSPDALWYIAGPPGMVKSGQAILTEINIPQTQIRVEEFSGYDVKAGQQPQAQVISAAIEQTTQKKKFSIYEKLILGFLLPSILLFFIGATGYIGIQKIKTEYLKIKGIYMPLADFTMELRIVLFKMHEAATEYITFEGGNPARKNEFGILRQEQKQLLEKIANYLAKAAAEEEEAKNQLKNNFIIISSFIEEFNASGLHLISAYDQGVAAGTTNIISDLEGGMDDFNAKTDAIQHLAGEEQGGLEFITKRIVFQKGEKLNHTILLFIALIVVLSFIAILASILIAGFISRNIIRSLQSVGGVAVAIASGNFDTPITIKSGDEVGELARAIEFMRQNLQSNIKKISELAAITQNSFDGIVITDPEGIIQYVNPAWEQLTGWTAKEVIGQVTPRILKSGQQSKEYYENMWKTIKGGDIFRLKVANKRKDGALYFADEVIIPLMIEKNNQKEITAFAAFQRDITKETQLDQAKSEFIDIAAHNLRTPLSTLRWQNELLLTGTFGELNVEQKENLNNMQETTLSLIKTLNDLLEVSKIEAGIYSKNLKFLFPSVIIDEVLSDLAVLLKIKSLRIEKNIPESLQLLGDAVRFKIIFYNLISNAMKYTPLHGKIKIEVALNNEVVLAKVSDTGIGIPKTAQDKIFTKTFRAGNAKLTEPTGFGLGLYLTKHIIEQFKGKIWFESEENKGTTFFVSLPAK